jgi:hypothetical protein
MLRSPAAVNRRLPVGVQDRPYSTHLIPPIASRSFTAAKPDFVPLLLHRDYVPVMASRPAAHRAPLCDGWPAIDQSRRRATRGDRRGSVDKVQLSNALRAEDVLADRAQGGRWPRGLAAATKDRGQPSNRRISPSNLARNRGPWLWLPLVAPTASCASARSPSTTYAGTPISRATADRHSAKARSVALSPPRPSTAGSTSTPSAPSIVAP